MQTEPDKICSKPQKALIAHAPKELKIRPVKNIHAQYREGIDVSHYQGDIDWNIVVKNANISYAYLKATEGATLVDDTYEKIYVKLKMRDSWSAVTTFIVLIQTGKHNLRI